jgi:hypothetical protein
MTCRAVYYNYIVNYVCSGFAFFRAAIGDDAVVLALLSLLSIVLVIGFHRVQTILVPRAVEWYSTKLLAEATNWFNKTNLRFLGFKFRTTVISVSLGAAFYVLAKIALAFPSYLLYSLPVLALVFVAIAFVGVFVSGNVPDARRNKYFKTFYVPTFAGVGLIAFNLSLDFLINLGAAIANLLQAV